MRLLKRKTEVEAPAAAPEGPAGTAPETAEPVAVTPAEAPEGVRACPACHAALADDQDWCLQCGSAQRRLGGRMPGMRAATTVAALTTVLVGGAVAASYAALQDEPAPAAPTTQVAQVPAPVTSTPTPSTPTPSPLDPPPTGPATSEAPVDSPPAPPDPGSTPDVPSSSGSGSSGSSSGSSGGSGSSSGSGSKSGSGSGSGSKSGGKGTSTTKDDPADVAPEPIALEAGAGALYDPYTRDTAAGDIGKAFDDNITTSFPITVADGSEQIGAGVSVDLGKKRAIREIDLTLKTPGAGLEVYATDDAELPPDILDSRWAHLRSLDSAGSPVDGHQTITLGTSKYRYVLLWFTTPPKSGTTVRVTELQLLG